MLYIKSLLVVFWLIFSSVLGLLYAILRWGNYNLNRDFGRFFSWGVRKILGIQVQIEGREHLESHQPCIYIVNHQSGLDMATMGPIYPRRTILIGKKEILWIPFFGIFYMAAGNIIIDRKKSIKAVAGLQNAVDIIKRDQVSIWIFPEGTRNKTGEDLLPFKRGAFHMALQAGIPLVPIVCGSLKNMANWKNKKLSKGLVKVRILPPIYLNGLTEKNIDQIVDNARGKMVEAFHSLST